MENREVSEETGLSPRNRENMMALDSFRDRPRSDFVLDPFHRRLRIISMTIAVGIPVFLLIMAGQLDEEIPMQYSFSGEVTRFGSPAEAILNLFGLGAVTLGLVLLTRYPQYFNYPFGLTKYNVQRQYLNAVQMMVWMIAAFTIIMVGIAGAWLGLLPRPIIVFPLVLLGATLIYFIARSARIR